MRIDDRFSVGCFPSFYNLALFKSLVYRLTFKYLGRAAIVFETGMVLDINPRSQAFLAIYPKDPTILVIFRIVLRGFIFKFFWASMTLVTWTERFLLGIGFGQVVYSPLNFVHTLKTVSLQPHFQCSHFQCNKLITFCLSCHT